MLLGFFIMSICRVRTAHGIENEHETNNVEDKGNESGMDNIQGIGHAHGIGTAQYGGPGIPCCACAWTICCPCRNPV